LHVYATHRFPSAPPLERWKGVYDLRDRPGEHLNKLMIREMKKLVWCSEFAIKRYTIWGPGAERSSLRWLDWLRHVPLIQEMYHSYFVAELRR
jgi:hypothetical protein